MSVVVEVSYLLEYDTASVGVWFPTFLDNVVVENVGNQTPSNAALYPM